jgi:tetratricopeptide (TPR) repeat protein
MIELKKAHELDIVELTEDLPEYGLRHGAQGTVVEVFDTPEEAYMVEFSEDAGSSSTIADWITPDQIKNISAIANGFYKRGMEALSQGNFVESLRELRKAVKLIPSYIGGMHNSLAQSVGPHDDWRGFIFAMRLVRLIDPDYEVARDNLAIAYLNYGVQEAKNGKYEESLLYFHAGLAVEASPEIVTLIKENIAASQTALGIQAFHNDDMQSNLAFFRSAHFIASNEITRLNFAKAHFHFANFCLNKGNLQLAIDSYARVEDAGLMLPDVLNNHACALVESKLFEDAMRILETAQAIAPEDEIIKSNLDKLLKISQISPLNVETTILDFIPKDSEINFLSPPPVNTVPLRLAA